MLEEEEVERDVSPSHTDLMLRRMPYMGATMEALTKSSLATAMCCSSSLQRREMVRQKEGLFSSFKDALESLSASRRKNSCYLKVKTCSLWKITSLTFVHQCLKAVVKLGTALV